MSEKKITKINLSTLFLILALIVIVVMAIFIYKFYNEKTEANENSAELQTQVSNLNGTVSNLQEKIDAISCTINSNESNTTNIGDNSNNNKTSSSQLSTEDTIKELFLSQLKATDASDTEKLIDYRVDEVTIVKDDAKQSILDMDSGQYYKADDTLAYVKYSVKPRDVNSTNWIAGSGVVEGEWIVHIACVAIRNGVIVSSGTGW